MWGPETKSREPRMPVGHHNYPRYVRTHVSQTREVRSDPLLTGEIPRGGNCRGTVCEHVFQRRSEGAQQTTRTGGATTRPPPKGSPPINFWVWSFGSPSSPWLEFINAGCRFRQVRVPLSLTKQFVCVQRKAITLKTCWLGAFDRLWSWSPAGETP